MDALKPQLYYFGFRGRAEIIRLTLAAVGVDFDYHQMSLGDVKHDFDVYIFGQAPRLVMDGLNLVQTKVIVRYLANKYRLYPDEPQARQYAEAIIDYFDDIFSSYTQLIYDSRLAEEAKVKYWAAHGNKDSLKNSFVGGHFEFLARLLRKNPLQSGFVFGSSLTVADIIVSHLTFVHTRPSTFQEQFKSTYPELVKHCELVLSLPSIQKYVSSPQRLPHTQGNGLGDD